MDFKTLQECLSEYIAPTEKAQDLVYWRNRCETSFNADPYYRNIAIKKRYAKERELAGDLLLAEHFGLVSPHFFHCLEIACQIPNSKVFLYDPHTQQTTSPDLLEMV